MDSEAEESGDDLPLDNELDDPNNNKDDGTGKMVIPEGIDIVERQMTEKEKMEMMDFYRQLREQVDEEQIEFVKRGVQEGARYMQRKDCDGFVKCRPNAKKQSTIQCLFGRRA